MKKKILLAVLSTLSLALVGCKGAGKDSTTSNVSPATSDVNPSTQTSQPIVHTFELSVNGNSQMRVNDVVSLSCKYDGTALTKAEKANVHFTVDTEAMTLNGDKLTLLKAGDFVVKAEYTPDGEQTKYEASANINVKDALVEKTIKAVKDASKEYNSYNDISDSNPVPVEVLTRGKVISSYGTGGVIADGEDAIEIYNWYYSDADTGIYKKDDETKSWLHVGDEVIVRSYAYDFYSQPQLEKSYKSKAENKYIDLVDASITLVAEADKKITSTITPVEISTEDQLKEFTSDTVKERTGHPYILKGAEYVRQTPSKENGKDYTIFKIGSTEFSLLTAGSNSKKYDNDINGLVDSFTGLNLTAGDKVDITTTLIAYEKKDGDTSKVGPKFSFYSKGTKIENVVKATPGTTPDTPSD